MKFILRLILYLLATVLPRTPVLPAEREAYSENRKGTEHEEQAPRRVNGSLEG